MTGVCGFNITLWTLITMEYGVWTPTQGSGRGPRLSTGQLLAARIVFLRWSQNLIREIANVREITAVGAEAKRVFFRHSRSIVLQYGLSTPWRGSRSQVVSVLEGLKATHRQDGGTCPVERHTTSAHTNGAGARLILSAPPAGPSRSLVRWGSTMHWPTIENATFGIPQCPHRAVGSGVVAILTVALTALGLLRRCVAARCDGYKPPRSPRPSQRHLRAAAAEEQQQQGRAYQYSVVVAREELR